jgi:hypothetical protein
MTERELLREVATVTGESLKTISDRGFVLLLPIPYELDREPLVIDWDELDAQRQAENGI